MLQQTMKTCYEVFELWQKAADHVWEEWSAQPVVVEAMNRNLSVLLAFRKTYSALASAFGLAASDDFLREFISASTEFMKIAAKNFVKISGKDLLPRLADTPCDVVYDEANMRLLRYRSTTRKYSIPILMVCSLVNRYYILDLTPGRSLVEYLLAQGYDVYIIDWGRVTAEEHYYGFEHYDSFIDRSVRKILQLSRSDQVTLLGYCIGGLLCTIYAARNSSLIKNLVLMATPIDFDQAGLISKWADERYFDVDALIDTCKVAPAELVQTAFVMLKPATNLTKYVNLLKHPNDEAYLRDFLALEIWAHDNVSIAGTFYRKLVKDLYQKNKLVRNLFEVGSEKVDLANISMPVLLVTSSHDHIVPTRSSIALMQRISSQDKEHFEFSAGHISMSVSDAAIVNFWPKLTKWLSTRSHAKQPERKARGQQR